jgi:hypothetical protein
MERLETFIDEFQTGKREGSVATNYTTGSLSADDKESWRQLRKDLESVGITPALFNQHHDLIIARLLEAINNGELVEYLSENSCGSVEESTEDRFAITDPTHQIQLEGEISNNLSYSCRT